MFMKDPDQQEFMQAVREVAVSLQPVFDKRPELLPIFKQASAAAGRRRRRCAAAATAAAAGALAASTGRGGAARCTQACAPVQPLPSHHPTPQPCPQTPQAEETAAKLRELHVDDFGRLTNWPDKFFGNALGETREQARLMFDRQAAQKAAS